MKMKNRSHRYDINRPRSRHGYRYSKYKKCLSMMMLIFIKQHQSNIWSSIHEKVRQHWGWVEKKALPIKKACTTISKIIGLVVGIIETSKFVQQLKKWRIFSNYMSKASADSTTCSKSTIQTPEQCVKSVQS